MIRVLLTFLEVVEDVNEAIRSAEAVKRSADDVGIDKLSILLASTGDLLRAQVQRLER
jgi:hypothetical protein